MSEPPYRNLQTFWTVVKEGSISRAGRKLHLAQPTISGQIRQLEKAFGQQLFTRVGRNLVPTQMGQIVYRYAEEIVSLGNELREVMGGIPADQPVRLRVGVTDALPKSVATQLLQPALDAGQFRLICREGRAEHLVAELAVHQLDVVLSDSPLGSNVKVKAFSHLLGECGVSIVAGDSLAKTYRRHFPERLDLAPFFLPTENTALRQSLDAWFESCGFRPKILAEFEDSALMKFFAREGKALCVVPDVVEKEVCRQFNLRLVGRVETVREKFFAISVERRITHPGVRVITELARKHLR